jgi:hypothetical protein
MDIFVEYFWHILALAIAPLLGFIVGQYYKANLRDRQITQPSVYVSLLNGVVSGGFAFWFWPTSDINEAAKIGAMITILSPIIVWAWFTIAKRWAPKQIEAFKDSGAAEEMTIIPWVYRKGKTQIMKAVVLPEKPPQDSENS